MSSFLHFDKDLDDLATELVRLSMLCGVRLREPGIVQAILENHSPVGCDNERAFTKMRGLLVLAYHMIEESAAVEGVEARSRCSTTRSSRPLPAGKLQLSPAEPCSTSPVPQARNARSLSLGQVSG